MKKNITINLCGRLYQIDEDAYELLSRYLDTLRNYFRKQEGGEEIANDIEDRITELFDELKSQGVEAITIENVQEIVSRIGSVSDFSENYEKEQDETSEQQEKQQAKPRATNTKKFYRDSQNKMLAGVLAGCSQYWGGSVNIWRCGFVGITIFFMFMLPHFKYYASEGFMYRTVFWWRDFDFMTFFPIIIYIIMAILFPATSTAEDVLKMKGKEVNPQNLGAEVTRNSGNNGMQDLWRVTSGILSICSSVILSLASVVALCFMAAFIFAPRLLLYGWFDADYMLVGDRRFFIFLISMCGITLVCALGILLYCSIHSAASSFGKAKSMGYKQRILWFVLWALSIASFVGFVVKTIDWFQERHDYYWEQRNATKEEYDATHTHDGIVYSDEDWEFFEKGGWTLTGIVNVDRYTYSGQYMTGDKDVRYLDAHSPYRPLIYTAEKTDSVQPGIYRLSAAVRSDNENRYIYAKTEDYVVLRAVEIPVYGNKGGNIWEALTRPQQNAKPIVKERIDRLSDSDKRKIRNANNGEGYGWSYICLDSIKISEPSIIRYGISTDERFTDNIAPTEGWFSATDFVLERIGDL